MATGMFPKSHETSFSRPCNGRDKGENHNAQNVQIAL